MYTKLHTCVNILRCCIHPFSKLMSQKIIKIIYIWVQIKLNETSLKV